MLLTTSGAAITIVPTADATPSVTGKASARAAGPSEAEVRAADFEWAVKHSKGGIPWALTQAKKTGRKTLVPDETTATSITYANPDGTLTSELSAGPARIQQDGRWVDVDARLTPAADGRVKAKAHPNGLELSGGGGTPAKSLQAADEATARDLVTLGEGKGQVTLQWKGGLPKPDLDGTRATYRDVLPGADVIVEATRTGFEQYVKLDQRPTGAYSYTMPLKAKGLKAAARTDGSVLFTDAKTGAERAVMPAPVMWDATVDKVSGKHENRHPVGMKVVDRGKGDVDLVVTPDRAWLADPATQYPVTVDPSTSNLTNVFDTYVQQGESGDLSTDVELDFGNPGTTNSDGTPRTARSFITWNTAAFKDALVTNADVSLWNFHSGNDDCKAYEWTIWDTTASSTASRWTKQPTWQQQYHSSTETKGNPACTTAPDGWISADVTTLVQSWSSALDGKGYMGLRAATDDVKAWKRVNSANATSNPPKLKVTWNYRPGDGTAQQAGPPFKSYAGLWAVNTTTPTLRDKFSDADGDTVNGTFQVYDAATNKPITTPAGEGLIVSEFVKPGEWASVKVPGGQLVDGKTYKFRTNAYDGTHYNLNFSPWREFVVDTTAPGVPKSVVSETYPENLPGGAVGEPGRFDVDTGVDDARDVEYRIGPADTDDDGNSGNTSTEGWQRTPTTNNGFAAKASFYAAPAEDGNHQAEVRSVDRADNTGATRVYGFASPRRTDTGRAKKIDIDLPKPNIGATGPGYHDEPQPAWDWATLQQNGMVRDGRPQVYRSTGPKSRSTVEDMMSDVLPAWAAITNWLAVHAPASHATLRPGAAVADVRSTEEALGMGLPVDLVTLLTMCDGTVDASALDRDPDEYDPGLFLAQHHLLPLEEIAQVRGRGGHIDPFWGSWVPFAVTDYSVPPWGGLAIDVEGRLATFNQDGGEPPSAPLTSPGYGSLSEFLDIVAEALTQGTGPLMAEATPGFHRGALVWGPLPGEGAPWTSVYSKDGSTA